MSVDSLTNEYLDNISRQILPKSFIGVIPSCKEPNIKNNKTFYAIFNVGEHFVSVHRNKNQISYFDSYGRPCQDKCIVKFIERHKLKRKYLWNNKKIQEPRSNFCGFYCLGFLISRCKRENTKLFVQKFKEDNLFKNDNIVLNYIVKNIKRK